MPIIPIENDPRVAEYRGAPDAEQLAVEALADVRVRIPIDPSMDSLNLATAAGIALHRLADPRRRAGLAL